MKYIIVVDKQTRTNPSSEKREYEINIDELRRKGDVHDDLKIEQGIAKVYRRIGLTKTHMTYILDNEVIEELGELKIKLFEGDNYIYIRDEYNNQMCTEYIVKSEFTDMFVTKLEMSSAIEQTSQSIDLSVDKKLEEYSNTEETKALIKLLSDEIALELKKKVNDEDLTGASIILRLNEDIAEAKISADKIGLEGYTTINGGFAIDEKGNANIANGSVKINNNGIELADGKKVIGGDGIYCNLQFFPAIPSRYGESSDVVGYGCLFQDVIIYSSIINIFADIPSNFTVSKAYITIQHQPVNWEYFDETMASRKTKGYGRNIQIYTDSLYPNETIVVDSDDIDYNTQPKGTNTKALGDNGKTFNSSTIETITSADLSSHLTPGKLTVFNIGSTTPSTNISNMNDAYAKSGKARVMLNVLGFLKV